MNLERINVARALGPLVPPLPTATVALTPTAAASPTYQIQATISPTFTPTACSPTCTPTKTSTATPTATSTPVTDGSGTMVVLPTSVNGGDAIGTVRFLFTNTATILKGAQMAVTVPAGWTAPQSTASTGPGFV